MQDLVALVAGQPAERGVDVRQSDLRAAIPGRNGDPVDDGIERDGRVDDRGCGRRQT